MFVEVSGIFLLTIGFLGFPRSPRGDLTLDPVSKLNSVSFESTYRFFFKEDLEGFVHVLPRALMNAVFQSVCNCFLSSSKVLNEF